MVFDLILVVVTAHARVCHAVAEGRVPVPRHAEGGHDEAKGVEDIAWHCFRNALDRIAYVLTRRD